MARGRNRAAYAFGRVVKALTPKSARNYVNTAKSAWRGVKSVYSGAKAFARNPIVKAAGRSLYGGVKSAGRLAYRGLMNSQRIVGQDARRLYDFGRSFGPGKKKSSGSGGSPGPAPSPAPGRTRGHMLLRRKKRRYRR